MPSGQVTLEGSQVRPRTCGYVITSIPCNVLLRDDVGAIRSIFYLSKGWLRVPAVHPQFTSDYITLLSELIVTLPCVHPPLLALRPPPTRAQISDNTAGFWGGGVFLGGTSYSAISSCTVSFDNTTVYGNSAGKGSGQVTHAPWGVLARFLSVCAADPCAACAHRGVDVRRCTALVAGT
jgi:hypothetical protein